MPPAGEGAVCNCYHPGTCRFFKCEKNSGIGFQIERDDKIVVPDIAKR
jgi:hypothetical protein